MSNYPTNTDESDFMQALLENDEEVKQVVTEKKETAIINSENNEAMQALLENAELAMLFNKTGTAGSEELGSVLPTLKIYSANKSTGLLMNGEEPTDGYLYYSPKKEQYQYVDAHIVAISRGYKAPPMEKGGKESYTQLVSGYFIGSDGDYLPFIIFASGTKWPAVRDFGVEIRPYTHMKPTPLPMYAIKVRIYGNKEKADTSVGKTRIFTYKVLRDENNFPIFETDERKAKFLADSIDRFKEQMNNIISNKSVSDDAIEIETL